MSDRQKTPQSTSQIWTKKIISPHEIPDCRLPDGFGWRFSNVLWITRCVSEISSKIFLKS